MLRQWRNFDIKQGVRWACTGTVFLMIFGSFSIVPAQAAIQFPSQKCPNIFTYNYCRGNTGVQAVFWTKCLDGSQTLETKRVWDDSITGFMNYDMAPWHLNEGLSLFFQVPVYERQAGFLPHIDTRTPV